MALSSPPKLFIVPRMRHTLNAFVQQVNYSNAVKVPVTCKALVYSEYGDPTKVLR